MLDPVLIKKLMLASEGIDERKVCGTRGSGGPGCFCSRGDCPRGTSGPVGIRDPASGAEVRAVCGLSQTLLQTAPPVLSLRDDPPEALHEEMREDNIRARRARAH